MTFTVLMYWKKPQENQTDHKKWGMFRQFPSLSLLAAPSASSRDKRILFSFRSCFARHSGKLPPVCQECLSLLFNNNEWKLLNLCQSFSCNSYFFVTYTEGQECYNRHVHRQAVQWYLNQLVCLCSQDKNQLC